MFEASDLNIRNRKVERLWGLLFLMMTVLLILPVIIILGMLVYKGGSVISIDFLFTSPTDGMTAGGVFPALLGTVWIVGVALLASVPIGIAAAIYLSEYAADNWFTRMINLAIVNLAGVPSIVHALFGVGAFVVTADSVESLADAVRRKLILEISGEMPGQTYADVSARDQ